jgi:hypothetical protein
MSEQKDLRPKLQMHNSEEKYRLICMGDTHSIMKTTQIIFNKLFYDLDANTIFLHVGDGGEGYSTEKPIEIFAWKFLDDRLREKNSFLYICRGNHSNPALFDLNHEYNCYLTNICFVPDLSYIQINGLKFLFIGGAVSIDRSANEINKTWWKNEGVVQDEKLINGLSEADVVIIHTAPTYCYPIKISPIVQYWMKFDFRLYDDLMLEKRCVDKMFEKVKPKFVARGHFHESHNVIVKSQSWIFQDLLLDIEETKDITEDINRILKEKSV